MEDFLSSLISSGPTGIICAVICYIVITLQRCSSKKDRDNTADNFDKRLSLLEVDNGRIHSQIDNIGDKLDKITDLLTLIQIELAKKQDKN